MSKLDDLLDQLETEDNKKLIWALRLCIRQRNINARAVNIMVPASEHVKPEQLQELCDEDDTKILEILNAE